MDGFSTVLASMRERVGVSQSQLARTCGLHPSIVSRLESGERLPTSRENVDRLAQGLRLDDLERSTLLASAGMLPDALARVGAADPDILLIARVLGDRDLPDEDRQDFRLLLRLLARRWQPRHRPR